ncbi:MAG TPA: hypothetical protein VMB79_01420 [Jatrophihabitans sp.]|nr:hypothetical protein [Jatrophihabitans sp.]
MTDEFQGTGFPMLPFWQVTFWTTRRADAFDQHCSRSQLPA